MTGANPYIDGPEPERPKKKYKILFRPLDREIEVDPAKLPYEEHGYAGSILDIALGHGISIDHACGGVCACSTCHVFIKQGGSSCNETSEPELDQLDNAPGNNFQSRLACQCVPDGSQDIVIEIPRWNRNLARESE